MPVYRYKRTGLDIAEVKKQVPPADAASVSAGSIGPTQVWDITAPTTSKDDLDYYMSSRGWTFDSTDPADTPAEQSAGDQDHGDLTGLGDDDHSQYHNNTRGDVRYYQKTDWSNKAQLDLVSDGDHDVRSDNPHSVTAAQAGAAVVTSTAPVNVTKATAAVGTSGEAARQDHKHDITTAIAAAQVPGDSAIEGSASSLARSDHKHSLPAYGTGSGTFCQGNDSRLSDARTPTSHATSHQSGGGDAVKLDDLAAPDDNTDLNATTSAHGLLLKLGGGSTNFLRADGSWAAPSGGTSYKEYLFQADQMESPNSSDWPDSDMATLAPSPSGDAVLIRKFDDTEEEGVGFTVHVPSGATNIIFDFLSQAVTAPGTAKVVKLDLYERGFPDNGAVDSWSSGYSLTDISIPANSNFQQDSQTIALSTLGLTANRMFQFELERDVSDAGDTLVGDWGLHSIRVRFS